MAKISFILCSLLLPLVVGGERISADTLQKMADNVMSQIEGKAYSEVTPEVKKTMEALIKLIDDDITPAIDEDFKTAQRELTELMLKLKEETEEAVQRKKEANHEDHERWECYGDEQAAKKALEKCDEDLEELLEAKWKACNFTDSMTWELSSGQYLNKTCSVKDAARTPPTADDCEPLKLLLDEEKKISNKLCKGLKSFRRSVVACEKATRAWERKYIECEALYESFEDQAEQCLKQEEWTRVRLCTSFGIEYQEKCKAYDDFIALKVQIQNKTNATHTANTYSEPDRKAEWTAVMKVKCMLKSYQEQPTPGFDKASWAKCEEVGLYPHVMDYFQLIIKGLMTVENFNCNETFIEFYEKYIHRSRTSTAGDERFVSISSMYTHYSWRGVPPQQDYLHKLFAVDKNEDNSPFTFCDGAKDFGGAFTGSTGEHFKDKVVVNENVQFEIGACDNTYVDEKNKAKFNTTKCTTTKCRDWKASVRQLECDQLQNKGNPVDILIGNDPHGGANKKCVKAPAGRFGCARNAGHPKIRINKDFWNAPDRFNIFHANGEVCAIREDNTKNNGWGMKLKIRCYEGAVEVDSQADTRRVCVHGHWKGSLTVKCREYWQPDAHDVDGWMNTTRGSEPTGPESKAPNTY